MSKMNKKYNKILFKVVISCLLVLTQASFKLRTSPSPEKVPFLVEISNKKFSYCGGSLVTQFHVLTAASCVYDKKPQEILVKAAASNRTVPGLMSTVSGYKVHADFNKATFDADVAVLKLSTPMTSIPIATLSVKLLRPGETLKVVWHATWKQKPVVLGADIQLLPMNSCLKKYAFRGIVTQTMFCARELTKHKCVGLSGGPVLKNGYVAGVVVYDIGCASQYNFTTVYTNVTAVTNFIMNNLL